MSDVAGLLMAQAEACRTLGSPFTARVLMALVPLMTRDTVLGRAAHESGARPEDALPLRLAGGLHALARSGDPDLAAIYPPHEVDEAALSAALARVIAMRGDALVPWLASPPQTNEVARSAVLIAVGHWLTRAYGLPLHLSELGASAGLNLNWDRYALQVAGRLYGPQDAVLTLTPDWTGTPPPMDVPRILSRAGVDLNPLDPVIDRDRLLAYLWADQAARLARCVAALDLAARQSPQVTQGDAAIWAEARLAQPVDGLHLVFHTVAAKYFSADTKARLAAALTAAGALATQARPLAHLTMEWDGKGPGAGVQLWPGQRMIALGRADFHGRWVNWLAS